MADQQPGEKTPAAGLPDPTRLDDGHGQPTTAAPSKWSGSATVPPPGPKKSRQARRQSRFTPENSLGTPPARDPDDWATMPAVDPWADQDTPVDAFPWPT